MLLFIVGFVTGVLATSAGIVLAGRALRQHRVQQPVDAGARHDIPVAHSTRRTWQETEERIAVLRWTPQHWCRPWPEA